MHLINGLEKYWKFIAWKNNAVCQNLNEASRAANLQLDCGANRMRDLMPTNNCFHSWVTYCFVLTRLFNRDKLDGVEEKSSALLGWSWTVQYINE